MNIERKNPYKVPEGYFSDLRNTLREQIGETETVSTAHGLWKKTKGMILIGASFAGMFALAVVAYQFAGSIAPKTATLADAQYPASIEETDLLYEDIYRPVSDEQLTEAAINYLTFYGYAENTETLLADAL